METKKDLPGPPSVAVSVKEEIVNSITHGVGALMAIAALVLLIVFSALYGNAWHVVSFAIFGSTLVVLYLCSTLYHSFRGPRVKHLFRKFDHISIYLLIAGTYTPFCLAAINGWIGWTIFGVVWAFTISGIVFKSLFTGKLEALSTAMYIAMGWVIVLAIKPLYYSIPTSSFALLVAGGLSYTAGTFFYVNHRIPLNHGIWHLFVLGGSVLHFFSVLHLLP